MFVAKLLLYWWYLYYFLEKNKKMYSIILSYILYVTETSKLRKNIYASFYNSSHAWVPQEMIYRRDIKWLVGKSLNSLSWRLRPLQATAFLCRQSFAWWPCTKILVMTFWRLRLPLEEISSPALPVILLFFHIFFWIHQNDCLSYYY